MEYGWGNQMLQKYFFCVVCMSCIIKWGTIFTCWSQLEYFLKKENGNWFSFGWAAWRTVKTMKSISKNRSTIPSIIPIMWFQLEVKLNRCAVKYAAQRNVKTLKRQSSPTVRTANYCPSLFSGKIDLLFSWSTRWWRGELHFIVRNSIQCSTLFEQSGWREDELHKTIPNRYVLVELLLQQWNYTGCFF